MELIWVCTKCLGDRESHSCIQYRDQEMCDHCRTQTRTVHAWPASRRDELFTRGMIRSKS